MACSVFNWGQHGNVTLESTYTDHSSISLSIDLVAALAILMVLSGVMLLVPISLDGIKHFCTRVTL